MTDAGRYGIIGAMHQSCQGAFTAGAPKTGGGSRTARAARRYVAALCLLGAVRVFIGSASLPLFNDVDEPAHFDVVHKLARGYWPVQPHETLDRETTDLQALYGSPEFLGRPEAFPGGVHRPPVWTWAPSPERDDYVERTSTANARYPNHEAHSPPVYYLAAAAWYNLGRLAGLSDAHAAYWIRFLNVPLFALLIAAAYAFSRAWFSPFVARTVPALLALFPSPIFFSITSDALSPLLVLLSLWLLLRWRAAAAPAPGLSLLAGLSAAAAFLVKMSNVAILAACGLVVAWRLLQARRTGALRGEWRRGALVLLAVGLPIAGWLLQNKLFLGDLTGTGAWMRELAWRANTVGEVLAHPFFTFAGQQAFWGRLLTSFYEGDMNWHGRPAMGFVPAKAFFLLSFSLPPLALGLAWFRRKRSPALRFPPAGVLCAVVLAGAFLFLIAQSLLWDFGAGAYPSRSYPYLNSGRLISGALVPFLALCACGVESILGRRQAARAAVIALSATMMLLPQAALLHQASQSRYNWFHLFVPGTASEAYTGRGLLALNLGRVAEATESFAKAADLDDGNVAALANLGNTLAAQGRHDAAALAFTRALRHRPGSAELHNSRGMVLAEQDRWPETAADHREAVRLSPQAPFYRLPLAHALSKTGRTAEANREYATALEAVRRWPVRSDRPAMNIATHPDPAVRLWLAARAVQRAEQADGTSGESQLGSLENLAVAYGAAGRFEETLAAADLAIRVAEEHGEFELATRHRQRRDSYRERRGRPENAAAVP